jgi:hypothetical protein
MAVREGSIAHHELFAFLDVSESLNVDERLIVDFIMEGQSDNVRFGTVVKEVKQRHHKELHACVIRRGRRVV